MITEKILGLSSQLANKIKSKGKMALPVPETPLDALCRKTTYYGVNGIQGNEQDIVSQSDNVVHNTYLDDIIKKVSDAVAGHIDFAKNVVNPSIKETVNYIERLQTEYTDKVLTDIEIIRVEYPIFLTNDLLQDDIKNYSVTSIDLYTNPDDYFLLENKTSYELIDYISTGNVTIDNDVKAWLSLQDENLLKDIWENFFVDPKLSDVNKKLDLISYLNHPLEGFHRAIALYLLTRKIKIDTDLDYREDKISFRNKVKQYLNIACFKLISTFNKFENAKSNNNIVYLYDINNRKIYTYKNTYEDWLEKGFTPEVLYGAFIKNEISVTEETLNRNKEEYLKAWTVHKAATNNNHRNAYHRWYIDSLRTAFYFSMNEMDSREAEFHQSNPDAKKQIAKLLEEELKIITIDDKKDYYRTVTRLVAKARYYYTDVYNFLQTVDELTKDHQVSLEEALASATIDYITDYVANQIVIK